MNAIILAAGMGTRLAPLTNNKPKSLIEVLGEPIVERQIRFLKEKGINDITVVTGYLSEQFNYLTKKYGVGLVYNDKYAEYNNLYTMYMVKDLLKDTYILEADVYMVTNYIDNKINKSTFFTGIKNDFENEWKIIFNNNNKINKICVESGSGYIHSGITYWKKNETDIIKMEIEKKVISGSIKNEYWDDIVIPIINDMEVYAKTIKSDDWFEIDSVKDLEFAEMKLKR